ncbi:MAG: radical SAM protein [Thermoprotei archaeon]|nr:radical SAM protein [Thermoprotei archaeon]
MKECREIREGLFGSKYVEDLPLGCKLCYQGAKAVIFITGICYEKCYYCPISSERKDKDVIYINEVRASSPKDILEEIYEMKALGASITGGEPLLFPRRVIETIDLLKSVFGEKFHIHLYTIGKHVSKDIITKLYNVGLDEIRFHVRDLRVFKNIELALKYTDIDVGIEVPLIPGFKDFYIKLLKGAERLGVKFVNFNEMEFTESNAEELRMRGFKLKKGSYVAVEGSEKEALELLKWASCNINNVLVHYCSIAYKDLVQTKRRLLRKAREIAKPFDEITDEGLVRRVQIVIPKENYDLTIHDRIRALERKFPMDIIVKQDKIVLNVSPKHARQILAEIGKANIKNYEAFIIEKYPVRKDIVKNIIPLSF